MFRKRQKISTINGDCPHARCSVKQTRSMVLFECRKAGGGSSRRNAKVSGGSTEDFELSDLQEGFEIVDVHHYPHHSLSWPKR